MSTIGNLIKNEIEHYASTRVRTHELFRATERGSLSEQQVKAYVSGILFQIRGNMAVLRRAEQRALAAEDYELAAHYRHKLGEERGHDRWAERDLQSLPGSVAAYGSGDSTNALALQGLVTYLRTIVDQDACLFLSYIILAEYMTVLVGPDWLRALESKCGISPAKLTVLTNHIELDREHVVEGVRVIDALVTSPEKRGPMLEVLRKCMACYEEFWDEIMSTTSKAA
jgi:pyrroloquinoline quinone (PQQ) biosynthesis protein C